MADSIVVPQSKPLHPSLQMFKLVPGIILLAVIGYGGKVIEQSLARYSKAHHLTLPNIEYVLWAILIGLLISNTVGVPEVFRQGVATYEFWLKAGIVLLGSRFILGCCGSELWSSKIEARYPSGKGGACKAPMHGFESRPRLHLLQPADAAKVRSVAAGLSRHS